MTNAYRDDLEAAQQRAAELERELVARDRELVELRNRTQRLEARLSGVSDTAEARENARRLEAALERERDELRQRFESDVEREIDRVRNELVRSERRVRDTDRKANRTVALVYAGTIGVLVTAAAGTVTVGLAALALFGVITAIGVSAARDDDRGQRS